MTSRIADVLDMLSDGKWYSLTEILQRARVHEDQLRQIMDFLKEYDFIVWDKTEKKVKLNRMAREFLAQTTSA
jgi:DNA-binding IclR family transcriptional regulator